MSFHLGHVRILGSTEFGNTKNYTSHKNVWEKILKLKKYYAENSAKQLVQKYKVNIWVETDNYQCKEFLLNISKV